MAFHFCSLFYFSTYRITVLEIFFKRGNKTEQLLITIVVMKEMKRITTAFSTLAVTAS